MIERWYRLAERFVLAVERMADQQLEYSRVSSRLATATERNAESNERTTAAIVAMSATRSGGDAR